MKLYASAASSFARKVRVMLLEKGIKHDLEMVSLWQANDLKKVNPVGKVPALVLDDGRVLISSPLIADYVDGRYPDPRFIPEDPDLRLEVRRWEALADATMDAVSAVLYERRFHGAAQVSEAWITRQQDKIAAGLAALERMLAGRRWCVGNAMSLAEVAIACHVDFINLRAPQFFPGAQHAGLAALCARMGERESMKLTAPPLA